MMATDELTQAEARTFVVLAVPVAFTAWDIGFDLGAFGTIDHRRFWAVWILCTVALAASLLYRSTDFGRIGRWRFVLVVPSLWLLADLLATEDSGFITFLLTTLSVATLPIAFYVLVGLLAGDFLRLDLRSQLALVGLGIAVFAVGSYVGVGHERFLTCDDFARAGDFVPENCTSLDGLD